MCRLVVLTTSMDRFDHRISALRKSISVHPAMEIGLFRKLYSDDIENEANRTVKSLLQITILVFALISVNRLNVVADVCKCWSCKIKQSN